MRKKVKKDLLTFMVYQEIHYREYRKFNAKYKEKEGVDLLDRYFNGRITRALNSAVKLAMYIMDNEEGLGYSSNKELDKQVDKLISKLLFTSYVVHEKDKIEDESEKPRKKINFDKCKDGLPKEFTGFVSGVILATRFFAEKYKDNIDEPEIKKLFDTYVRRVDSIVTQLVRDEVVRYEEM